MTSLRSLALLGCWLATLSTRIEMRAAAPPTRPAIRDLLHGPKFSGRAGLVKQGPALFLAFETILADPQVTDQECLRILDVLCEVKGDKRRFFDGAFRALWAGEKEVRRPAGRLLRQIYIPDDGSPLVALLSSVNQGVGRDAADLLADVGGPRELVALDAWLLVSSDFRFGDLKPHVKKCRDRLARRLASKPR